jgi:microcystin-dependent protein
MRSIAITSGQPAFAQQHNNLRSDAIGAASLLVHQQLGALALGTAPTNGQTVTLVINGTSIVFTAVGTIGSTPGNILNPGTAAGFVANLLALLNQPQLTTTVGVALSTGNQALVSYLSYALVGTTFTISSNNKTAYAPLTSFTASTTVTSGSYTAQTMQLFVEPGVAVITSTNVNFAGGSTPTFTAPSSHPRIDLITIDATGTLALVTGTESASPSVPAYPVGTVTLAEVFHAVGETALYDNDNQQAGQGYIQRDARPFFNITQIVQSGLMMMWPIAPAPIGWLACDGSAISRATYPALFAIVAPTFGTITVTIASPAVVSATGHGLQVGDQVYFTTTGALPTGLSANTLYYVITAGFGSNSFEVSATRGGSAINTSGSQSGTHTMVKCPFGLGDGSTTFNLPDMRANFPLGYKAGDTNAGYYGQKGGEATHTLTASEIPSHTHNLPQGISLGAGGATGVATSTNGTTNGTNLATDGGSGGGGAHNNVPPFAVLLFIIKT